MLIASATNQFNWHYRRCVGVLQKNVSDAQLCTTLKLSGRKMLLVRQQEGALALFALNDVR
ncbi:tRNA-binding protein [Escherichia coli]